MTWTNAPALRAIIADANNVAPGRSTASDGTVGDLTHQAQGAQSDHNPDARGVVHAVDITNDPAHGMDTWFWAQIIADRIKSGAETRVRYLVSNDGHKDVIFNPSVSMVWRQNGSAPKQDHTNHLHTSILSTVAAENDVRPYFVRPGGPVPTPSEDDLTPEQAQKLNDLHSFMSEIKVTNPPQGSPPHVGALQKLTDLHAFMSEIKAKVRSVLGLTG
jgi:hypothetical protein